MASKAVADAVIARLGATWNGLNVNTPNTSGGPPADGSAWLDLQFPTATETIVGFGNVGSRRFREDGTIRIVVLVPINSGVEQGLAWCDQLRMLFRAQQFSGVTCLYPSPAFDNDKSDDGIFFMLSIIVPYYFDFYA